MLAVYVAILSLTCHFSSCQVDKEVDGPAMPVRPDGSFYNTVELIELWKHKGESHHVTTEDGYVLSVYRVVPSQRPAPVVLLQHGFLCSSDCWVTDPDALAFKMSDAGFDVWISNVRGNVYSRNHTTFKPDDKEFWDFSWHEMGTMDLPAVIDYVLQTTGENKLHYIGHSMGSSAGFVLLSVKPDYNQRLHSLITLAPVAFFSKMTDFVGPGGMLEELAAKFMEQLKTSGKVEMLPRKDITNNGNMQITCDDVDEKFRNICSDIIQKFQYSLGGAYIPAGQSLKTLDHFYQTAVYGSMKFYNMSAEENKRVYGSEEPPAYLDKFRQISTPVLLWSTEADVLVSTKDVDDLVAILPNVVSDNRIKEDCFNHEGFLLTRTESCIPARAKVYSDIIESMKLK